MNIDEGLSNKISNMSFVCSCLVVLLHVDHQIHVKGFGTECLHYICGHGLGRCAVPFFFIASGFFLAGHMHEHGWWRRESLKRLRTLFAPYLFWNVVHWGFMHLLGIVAGFVGVAFASDIGWKLNLGLNPFDTPQHPHLWFLRALMIFFLVSPVFVLLKKRISGAIGLFFLVTVCCCLSTMVSSIATTSDEAFAIQCWLRGFAFFATGVYLRYNPICHDEMIPRGVTCFIALPCALLPWIVSAALDRHGLTSTAQAVDIPFVLVSVYFLFESIPSGCWARRLTSCAFPIYLIHSLVLILFMGLFRCVGLKEYLSHCTLLFFMFYYLLVLGVSIGFTLLMRKVRGLAFLAFGGR